MEWAYAVYHMYVVRTGRRDELAKHLQSKGIGTGVHYPVANHQQPAVTKIYSDLPKLPHTEAAVKEILSLPIYGELPPEDVDTFVTRSWSFSASDTQPRMDTDEHEFWSAFV